MVLLWHCFGKDPYFVLMIYVDCMLCIRYVLIGCFVQFSVWMDKLFLEISLLVRTCCKAGFRCKRECHFPTARLLMVEMEGFFSISTPWENVWGMKEVRGALANESSHEIQTETAVYYFSDMWHPAAKISLFIWRKENADPRCELFLMWT